MLIIPVKRLFKLADTDKTSTAIATEREDLDAILKASVPGLVTHGLSAGDKFDESGGKTLDRSGTGHKLLVDPSVFNMSILLPPSLSFLTRLRDIVPTNSDVVISTLTSFLDDFLVNVFEPQMEETLSTACGGAYSHSDAFQEDPKWQTQASRPVFKSTVEVFQLLDAFCRMLVALPPRQSFSELIIGQIRGYYNRLNDIYRSIVTKTANDASASKTRRKAASLAEGGDLLHLIKTLIDTPNSATEELWMRETSSLISIVKTSPKVDDDLLSSTKSIRQLAVLFTSSLWFSSRLQTLRHIDPQASSDTSTSLAAHQSRAWTDPSSSENIYLPLSSATAEEFDHLMASFAELSALALRTLHLELRLEVLSGIFSALSSNYYLNQPYNEPDSAILALNKTMLAVDVELSSRLPPSNYTACTSHLAEAVDAALIAFASQVPAMNRHGAKRMSLNILVLQQGLKEMQTSADLGRAAEYWALWDTDGTAVVREYRAGKIGREEAREMARLCFGDGDDGRKSKLDEVLGILA